MDSSSEEDVRKKGGWLLVNQRGSVENSDEEQARSKPPTPANVEGEIRPEEPSSKDTPQLDPLRLGPKNSASLVSSGSWSSSGSTLVSPSLPSPEPARQTAPPLDRVEENLACVSNILKAKIEKEDSQSLDSFEVLSEGPSVEGRLSMDDRSEDMFDEEDEENDSELPPAQEVNPRTTSDSDSDFVRLSEAAELATGGIEELGADNPDQPSPDPVCSSPKPDRSVPREQRQSSPYMENHGSSASGEDSETSPVVPIRPQNAPYQDVRDCPSEEESDHVRVMSRRWPTEDGGFLLVQRFQKVEHSSMSTLSSSMSDFSGFSMIGSSHRQRSLSETQEGDEASDTESEASSSSFASEETLPVNMTVRNLPPALRQYLHHRNDVINSKLSLLVVLVLTAGLTLGIGHFVGSSQMVNHHRSLQEGQKLRLRSLQDELVTCMEKRKAAAKQLQERDEEFQQCVRDKGALIESLANSNGDRNGELTAGCDSVNVKVCNHCQGGELRYSKFCNTLCPLDEGHSLATIGSSVDTFESGPVQPGSESVDKEEEDPQLVESVVGDVGQVEQDRVIPEPEEVLSMLPSNSVVNEKDHPNVGSVIVVDSELLEQSKIPPKEEDGWGPAPLMVDNGKLVEQNGLMLEKMDSQSDSVGISEETLDDSILNSPVNNDALDHPTDGPIVVVDSEPLVKNRVTPQEEDGWYDASLIVGDEKPGEQRGFMLEEIDSQSNSVGIADETPDDRILDSPGSLDIAEEALEGNLDSPVNDEASESLEDCDVGCEPDQMECTECIPEVDPVSPDQAKIDRGLLENTEALSEGSRSGNESQVNETEALRNFAREDTTVEKDPELGLLTNITEDVGREIAENTSADEDKWVCIDGGIEDCLEWVPKYEIAGDKADVTSIDTNGSKTEPKITDDNLISEVPVEEKLDSGGKLDRESNLTASIEHALQSAWSIFQNVSQDVFHKNVSSSIEHAFQSAFAVVEDASRNNHSNVSFQNITEIMRDVKESIESSLASFKTTAAQSYRDHIKPVVDEITVVIDRKMKRRHNRGNDHRRGQKGNGKKGRSKKGPRRNQNRLDSLESKFWNRSSSVQPKKLPTEGNDTSSGEIPNNETTSNGPTTVLEDRENKTAKGQEKTPRTSRSNANPPKLNIEKVLNSLDMSCQGEARCVENHKVDAARLLREMISYRQWLWEQRYRKDVDEVEDFMEELEEFIDEDDIDDDDIEDLKDEFEDMVEDIQKTAKRFFKKQKRKNGDGQPKRRKDKDGAKRGEKESRSKQGEKFETRQEKQRTNKRGRRSGDPLEEGNQHEPTLGDDLAEKTNRKHHRNSNRDPAGENGLRNSKQDHPQSNMGADFQSKHPRKKNRAHAGKARGDGKVTSKEEKLPSDSKPGRRQLQDMEEDSLEEVQILEFNIQDLPSLQAENSTVSDHDDGMGTGEKGETVTATDLPTTKRPKDTKASKKEKSRTSYANTEQWFFRRARDRDMRRGRDLDGAGWYFKRFKVWDDDRKRREKKDWYFERGESREGYRGCPTQPTHCAWASDESVITIWEMYKWLTERFSLRESLRAWDLDDQINWFLCKP